jgi:hypothetical protein
MLEFLITVIALLTLVQISNTTLAFNIMKLTISNRLSFQGFGLSLLSHLNASSPPAVAACVLSVPLEPHPTPSDISQLIITSIYLLH